MPQFARPDGDVDASASPRIRSGLDEVRDRDCRQKTDNGNHDHDFNQGETGCVFFEYHG